MSNIIDFNARSKLGLCDMCGRHEPGMQLVKDEEDKDIPYRNRCVSCISEWGGSDDCFSHVMGKCDPVIDLDTRWQLLALLSGMVRLRDSSGSTEVSKLVGQLGRIIERHEPALGGDS
ncbi:hypothetical protein [Halomonas sp.]|uniref:hypothetical protein n=1 Tax=unclassified Halomonas TaxID=2609666 RepID=UPI003F92B9FE